MTPMGILNRLKAAAAVRGLLAMLALGGLHSTADAQTLTGGRNADKPIDITADRLDVAQDEKVATFSGNVKAIQGDMTLQTQVLKVYYGRMDEQDGGSRGGSDQGGSGNLSIRRLEATGGVVLQSGQETARGQRAVYDLLNRTALVLGDVVLTRGESRINGERLTIDFNSGQSRMEGGVAASQGQGQGRVRGVFQPQSRGQRGAAGPAQGQQR